MKQARQMVPRNSCIAYYKQYTRSPKNVTLTYGPRITKTVFDLLVKISLFVILVKKELS